MRSLFRASQPKGQNNDGDDDDYDDDDDDDDDKLSRLKVHPVIGPPVW